MNEKFDFDTNVSRYLHITEQIKELQEQRKTISQAVAAFVLSKNVEQMNTRNGRIVRINYSLNNKLKSLPMGQYKKLAAWCKKNGTMSINYISLVNKIRAGEGPDMYIGEMVPHIKVGGISKRLKKLL